MYNYISENHPIVLSYLNSNDSIVEFEDYVGSRISLSPVVFSLTSNGCILDLLDTKLKTFNGTEIKIKKIIDIVGNKISWNEDIGKDANYSIDTNNLNPISGEYSWMGTRIYLNGTIHIVCYVYPKLKIGKEWSDNMLLFAIPFFYLKESLRKDLHNDVAMYETYLNRLINFYNANRVVPMMEVNSSLGGTNPYEL